MVTDAHAWHDRTLLPLLAALLIPGSGHILLGQPRRGLRMLAWMLLFGFLTCQLSNARTSFVGHFSGGFAVWVLSILDVARILRSAGGSKAKPGGR
jgi:TM2 domain-containing membrane protein YozV